MAKFQSLWIGKELSPLEILCIRTFLAHGHEFELYAYDDLRELPAGCVLQDAGSILPRDRVFNYRKGAGKGSPAGFSNLFRYKLLAEHGGWWIDTDVLCLTSDLPGSDIVFAPEEPGRYNSAILKFPAGHPLMAWAYAAATEMGRSVRFGQTGPQLLTRGIQEHGMHHLSFPQRAFYPVHYTEAACILDPTARETVAARTRNATFLHLWNEIFRRMHYAKTFAPPPGSYLRACFEAYGMIGAFHREYFVVRHGDQVYLRARKLRDRGQGGRGLFTRLVRDRVLPLCLPAGRKIPLPAIKA